MKWILPILIAVLTGCTSNIFEGSVETESDAALLYSAEAYIDSNQYALAIAELDKMSADFLATHDVQVVRATALAGDCGLRFITFFQSIGSLDFDPFFSDIMSTFAGVEAVASQCVAAEAIMLSLDTSSTLDSEEQFFYVILSLAKMASVLRTNADTDGVGNLGDGSADPGFDACDTNSISDSDVAQVIIGLSLFIQNFAVLSASLGDDAADLDQTQQDLQDACDLDPSFAALCNSTTEDEASAVLSEMRQMLDSSSFGVGSCADPLLCCP